MLQIFALVWLEIKKLLRMPSSLVIMFVMPLLFTFIFGGLFGGEESQKTRITVVDQDQTMLSKAFIKRLSQDPIMEVKQASQSVGEEELKEKKIAGLVIIPKGFAEKITTDSTPVVFRHGPELTIAASIRQTLDNASNQLMMKVKAAELWSKYKDSKKEELLKQLIESGDEPLVSVQSEQLTADPKTKTLNYTSQQAVGFSIMFLMFMILTATGAILQARQIGVWSRMMLAPVNRLQILLGYLFAFFLMGWLQFSILMILSSVLFGVEWGDLLSVIVLVSVVLLAVIGLGLLLAGIVKTAEQQSAIGTLVIVSTCMLGGIFWPLEVVPEFMQKVAEFVPQTWAMRGTLVDIWEYVLILLGFTVVFLGIGISRIRFEA
jgi:ABC-2 type transport system permease protein